MLTKIEAKAPSGEILVLTLNSITSGFSVLDVDGLDPVNASIVSSDMADTDGQQYQSSRRGARNVKIVLGLEPDYVNNTVRSLRSILYNFFMPKTSVELYFYTIDGLILTSQGVTETFVCPIFTKDPTATINVTCFDPDLIDTTLITVIGNTVSDNTETDVSYVGTSDVGFVFDLAVNRAVSSFVIHHRAPDGKTYNLTFTGSLIADDVLTISTIPGDKHVTLTRSGIPESVLYGVPPQSTYIQLARGTNYIRVYSDGAAIPYTIKYRRRYGGL